MVYGLEIRRLSTHKELIERVRSNWATAEYYRRVEEERFEAVRGRRVCVVGPPVPPAE